MKISTEERLVYYLPVEPLEDMFDGSREELIHMKQQVDDFSEVFGLDGVWVIPTFHGKEGFEIVPVPNNIKNTN